LAFINDWLVDFEWLLPFPLRLVARERDGSGRPSICGDDRQNDLEIDHRHGAARLILSVTGLPSPANPSRSRRAQMSVWTHNNLKGDQLWP